MLAFKNNLPKPYMLTRFWSSKKFLRLLFFIIEHKVLCSAYNMAVLSIIGFHCELYGQIDKNLTDASTIEHEF
jgi:hypothetical protein